MWIVYNTNTGTLILKQETQPTDFGVDNSIVEVNFVFMPSQPLYLLRYDGNIVIANTEENIQVFKPIESINLDYLPTFQDLNTISNPTLNQIIYIDEYNTTFKYNGSEWVQSSTI